MSKYKITLIILPAALLLTACGGASATENNNTTEGTSRAVTSEEAAAARIIKFNAAAGKVTAVKTALLSAAPERGAGYEGFILKGEEAELKGIDESGKWSLINYNGADYYVLSSYLASAESGISLDASGADDMVTEEVIKIEITTKAGAESLPEGSSSGSTASGGNTGSTKPSGNTGSSSSSSTPGDIGKAESGLERSTVSGESAGSTKPSGNAGNISSENTAGEALTQPATEAPKPTEAPQAPKPTEAPKPAYNPSYVISEAIKQLKAEGYIYLPEDMDTALADGRITKEDYDKSYPTGGSGYFETSLYNVRFGGTMEDDIYELVETCKYLCVGNFFYIEYVGEDSYDGYVYRCYR